MYLEHLVRRGRAMPQLHNELGFLLLEGLQAAGAAEGRVARLYRYRLRRFLRDSADYHAEHMLQLLPADGFVRERALVLSRLGRHEDVLRIYVQALGAPKLAEQYCDRIWRGTRIQQKP